MTMGRLKNKNLRDKRLEQKRKDGFTQVSDATINGPPDVTPKARLAYQPSYAQI